MQYNCNFAGFNFRSDFFSFVAFWCNVRSVVFEQHFNKLFSYSKGFIYSSYNLSLRILENCCWFLLTSFDEFPDFLVCVEYIVFSESLLTGSPNLISTVLCTSLGFAPFFIHKISSSCRIVSYVLLFVFYNALQIASFMEYI